MLHVGMLYVCSDIAMEDTNSAAAVDVDLSKYVAPEKLSAMSELERKCCANRIRNYQMMREIGN